MARSNYNSTEDSYVPSLEQNVSFNLNNSIQRI